MSVAARKRPYGKVGRYDFCEYIHNFILHQVLIMSVIKYTRLFDRHADIYI